MIELLKYLVKQYLTLRESELIYEELTHPPVIDNRLDLNHRACLQLGKFELFITKKFVAGKHVVFHVKVSINKSFTSSITIPDSEGNQLYQIYIKPILWNS